MEIRRSNSRTPVSESESLEDFLWIDVFEGRETSSTSKRLHIANTQRKRREILRQNAKAKIDRTTQTICCELVGASSQTDVLSDQDPYAEKTSTAGPDQRCLKSRRRCKKGAGCR